jgi:hypothetical protein
MPVFLRVSLGFYLLATALGVVLRVFIVAPFEGLVFANALHAHSHTLYFGWCALGILALIFQRLGAGGPRVHALLWAIAAISASTFVSFLQGGYSPLSIALSSLSLVVWASSAVIFWKSARGKRGLDVSFFRAAVAYLVIASMGAIARVVLIAFHASTLQKSLAIFAFLHNFAWFFVFAIIGLLLSKASALGVRFDEGLLRRQLQLSAPLAWLSFPLGVAGGADGLLGGPARLAAVALFVPAAFGVVALWRAAATAERAEVRATLRWLALWLGLEASLGAAGGLGLASVAVVSRHLAILYLHVLLVGVVSLGLMVAMLASLGARIPWAMWLHNLGLAVMSLGLALGGIGALGRTLSSTVPRLGLILAAIGGALIFVAGLGWARAVLWASQRSTDPRPISEPEPWAAEAGPARQLSR